MHLLQPQTHTGGCPASSSVVESMCIDGASNTSLTALTKDLSGVQSKSPLLCTTFPLSKPPADMKSNHSAFLHVRKSPKDVPPIVPCDIRQCWGLKQLHIPLVIFAFSLKAFCFFLPSLAERDSCQSTPTKDADFWHPYGSLGIEPRENLESS